MAEWKEFGAPVRYDIIRGTLPRNGDDVKPTTEESTLLMSEIRDIREALHRGDPASKILRSAWEVAHKTQCLDMEAWIKSELRGYAQDEEAPGYRWVYAEPERRLWGDWYVHYPLDSNIPGARDKICRVDVRLSVTEIEDCLSQNIVPLRLPIPIADLERFSIVDPILYEKVEVVWAVSGVDLRKIVAEVRRRISVWCIKIESSRSRDATDTQKDSVTTENTPRPMKMIDVNQYDAIVFGVYGTLLSHHHFKETMVKRFGEKIGEILFLRWRREHERAICNCAQQPGYGDYFTLARNAFRTGIGHEGERQIEDALMKLYCHPPVYREVQAALSSPRHRAVLAVTNAPRKDASQSLYNESVNLLLRPEELSFGLISAEDVSSFMPNPEVYQLIRERANVPPQKVLVLTDSVYIARGAVQADMGAVLVKRTPDPHDDTDTGQIPVVSGLHEVFRHL